MTSFFNLIRATHVMAATIAGAACIAWSPLRAEPTVTDGAPRLFATPEDAVKALTVATQAGDHAALGAIFGPGVKDLLSGDPRQDALEFTAFSKLLAQFSLLVRQDDARFVLNLGDQNWPFPIPIVKKNGAWSFDTAAGRVEIVNRRIGEDEFNAIGVCQTYVEAQREYAGEDRVGDGVLRFAQRLRSSRGKKDGLYWPATKDEEPSPFGPLIAEVHAEGYGGKTAEAEPQPYKGYRFKILTSQGSSAAGGAFDYVINGNMIAGFALVAYPAHWGESGVMTFVVNQWGKVYERNLGASSATVAAAMTSFDPDADWTPVP